MKFGPLSARRFVSTLLAFCFTLSSTFGLADPSSNRFMLAPRSSFQQGEDSAAKPEGLVVRGDIAKGYPDLFGDKTVNGRTLNVDELIVKFTQEFGPDFSKVLSARQEFLSQVAEGKAQYGFANPTQVVVDADGKKLTVAQIRQGMIDNSLGMDSPYRWKLNANVPTPAEVTRPGLQGTGPADDLGMAMGAINAAEAGAVSWMWDWEDAGNDFKDKFYLAWRNLKELLAGFWSGTYHHPEKKKDYSIHVSRDKWPTIFHRVPGIHLKNRQIQLEGKNVPGIIVAQIIHTLNNYDSQKKNGSGIYFYIPKIETPQEALIVAKLLKALEEAIGVARGTLKIEMLNERARYVANQEVIMWVLKDWLVGPNVGRWDYINSRIEMLKDKPEGVFPDPHTVGMTDPTMTEYTRRPALLTALVDGYPVGGMSAVMKNPTSSKEVNEKAVRSIFFDKLRERLTGLMVIGGKGFDLYRQSWVATTEEEYVRAGAEPLQVTVENLPELISRLNGDEKAKLQKLGLIDEQGRITPYLVLKEDLTVENLFSSKAWDKLFRLPEGPITEKGLRYAVYMASEYMYQQLNGNNAAAIDDYLTGNRLMNDFATYEIFWHWLWTALHHQVALTEDGETTKKGDKVTPELIKRLLAERSQAVDTYFSKQDKEGVKSRFDRSKAPLTMDILERQLFHPKWIQYGARVLDSVKEVSEAERKQILDAVFSDSRETVIQKVATGEWQPGALTAYDFVYDIFEEGAGSAAVVSEPNDADARFERLLTKRGQDPQLNQALFVALRKLYGDIGQELEKVAKGEPVDAVLVGQSVDAFNDYFENLNDLANPTRVANSVHLTKAIRMAEYNGVLAPYLVLEFAPGVADSLVFPISFDAFKSLKQFKDGKSEKRLVVQHEKYLAKIGIQTSEDREDFKELNVWVGRGVEKAPKRLGKLTSKEEEEEFQREVGETQAWMSQPRFKNVKRTWTAEDIVRLRPRLRFEYPYTNLMARKFWGKLQELKENRKNGKGQNYIATWGPIDGAQATVMAFGGLEAIYVSGWQASLLHYATGRTGPDLAKYTYNTVPNVVARINYALQMNDARQREERSRLTPEKRAKTPIVDFFLPIFADADTGHEAVRELTDLFIEAGASAIHLEDQAHGKKKCGHMSGKVLVPMQEHANRLLEARSQADLQGSEILLVARTDSEAAKLLTQDNDPRDHWFILGTENEGIPALGKVIGMATDRTNRKINERRVKELEQQWPTFARAIRAVWEYQATAVKEHINTSKDIQETVEALSTEWNKQAKLKTYYQAVADTIRNSDWKEEYKKYALETWEKENGPFKGLAHREQARLAKKLGVEIYWDKRKPRTYEGYFQVQSGVHYAAARGRAFAPYADILWMEQEKPILEEAAEFAHGVLEAFPDALLAANNSPSFNWDNPELHKGLAPEQIDAKHKAHQDKQGDMGYVFQFITLAGMHLSLSATHDFAGAFLKDGMLAYVLDVQRHERETGAPSLKHQWFAGSGWRDAVDQLVYGGASATGIGGKGLTEKQFDLKAPQAAGPATAPDVAQKGIQASL